MKILHLFYRDKPVDGDGVVIEFCWWQCYWFVWVFLKKQVKQVTMVQGI